MKYINSNTNKRYYTLDYYLKEKFGEKVAKVSLNAGFTCPNIDGKKGYGGCTFCRAGSSAFAGDKNKSIEMQFEEGVNKIKNKWLTTKFIAYFQAGTNTYGTVNYLRSKFDKIIEREDVVGISIGTRSDALNDEIYKYLNELNSKTYLSVELGLQSINEITLNKINRLETKEEFESAIKKLKDLNIFTTVHIINGFKDDTKEDMLNIIRYLNKLGIDGIKIHSLFIEKGTKMGLEFEKQPWKTLSLEEYVEICCDQIEELNENIVIERITGDPEKNVTIAPFWTHKKFVVLNEIDKELERRNSIQGINHSIDLNIIRVWEEHISRNDLVFISSKSVKLNDYLKNNTKINHCLCDENSLIGMNNLSIIHLDYFDGLENKLEYYMEKLNPKGIITIKVGKKDLDKFNIKELIAIKNEAIICQYLRKMSQII